MKRTLFVDATQGAAGDMILGGLLDLGVPESIVVQALESLPLTGWELSARKIERCALVATQVEVLLREPEQDERNWGALESILSRGQLTPTVRESCRRIFRRLIEAEAEVHGRSPEAVHLHEAGGTDAIIDVVGACVAIEHLDVDEIVVSELTTGFGEVTCAHGVYPVPAPATTLLIRGAPVRGGVLEFERLTPTGAAILTTLAARYGSLPAFRPAAVGYGAGSKELESTPNMVRMIVGETGGADTTPDTTGEICVIECTVDETTPQAVAYTMGLLLEAGALDAFTSPVLMKKGRQGHRLTALCRPERLDDLARLILKETSSLGVRFRRESRIELDRKMHRVETEFGPVHVKAGLLDGRVVHAWPEYDDCAKLARQREVPLRRVQQAALDAFDQEHD